MILHTSDHLALVLREGRYQWTWGGIAFIL